MNDFKLYVRYFSGLTDRYSVRGVDPAKLSLPYLEKLGVENVRTFMYVVR